MFTRASSSGGGGGERGRKKGKLSAWFLSKETIQTTAGMAMGGRGSLPGSLSFDFSCAIIRACVKEKRRGRAWVGG